MKEWTQARNLLVVRMDNMGDIIMLEPALRAIKETNPQAHITLLASPAGTVAAQLLPWIDDIITWRSIWQDVGNRMPFEPEREYQLIKLLAERHFDAALIFTSFSQNPHIPAYVCYLAGIPLRAGESKEFGGGVLTNELKGAPDEMHQVERNLCLIEQLGFSVHDRRLHITLTSEDRKQARSLLQSLGIDPTKPYVLIHPGASARARRYPAQRFAAVTRSLIDHGRQVLVTGVEREADLLNEMEAAAPGACYLAGKTTTGQYAALIEQASVLVCNNTLALHLGDALLTPEVVLYSGTEYEEQWRPRTAPFHLLRRPTPCSPCYLFECPIGHPCLDIEPQEVVAAIENFLSLATEAQLTAIQQGSEQ